MFVPKRRFSVSQGLRTRAVFAALNGKRSAAEIIQSGADIADTYSVGRSACIKASAVVCHLNDILIIIEFGNDSDLTVFLLMTDTVYQGVVK